MVRVFLSVGLLNLENSGGQQDESNEKSTAQGAERPGV